MSWTEERAWMYLADRWSKALPNKAVDGDVVAMILREPCLGLCASIAVMGIKVEPSVHDIMLDRTYRFRPTGIDASYWWPNTMTGARARAAKCRAMARLAAKAARGDG